MITALRYAIAGLGVVGIGYGAVLLWSMSSGDKVSIASWLAGGLIAHDAVFAPLCVVVAFALRKSLSRAVSTPVLVALALTVAVLVLALPVVLPRPAPANATLLDRPYGVTVPAVIAAIWVITVVTIVIRGRTHRDPSSAHDASRADESSGSE